MFNDYSQFGRIGILMGGYSSEREISLKSGRAVFEALLKEGCDVVPLDIVERRREKISNFISQAKIDLAFIALHGRLGEDGFIQTILEELQIPYTGSGPQASRLAINKVLAQKFFRENNIPVAPHAAVRKDHYEHANKIWEQLGSRPVVVKPACEGSSIGVSVVRECSQLAAAIDAAFRLDNELLIEAYIQGREFTVGILEERPLAVIEVCPQREFFDFTAKYKQGLTEYQIPARIPHPLAIRLQEVALKAHFVLGCRDLSRVDCMVDDQENIYVLELNSIPGFTATSLLPKAAKAEGINFNQLCLKLIGLAYGKKKENKNILAHR